METPDVHHRLVNRLYGLTEWKDEKSSRNSQEMRTARQICRISNRAIREWSAALAIHRS